MEIKTELDYELKRFNKEKEVKKLNEEFENRVIAINMTPPLVAGDIAATPLPSPALIELQKNHRKALKDIAKENGYNLVYEHLLSQEKESEEE